MRGNRRGTLRLPDVDNLTLGPQQNTHLENRIQTFDNWLSTVKGLPQNVHAVFTLASIFLTRELAQNIVDKYPYSEYCSRERSCTSHPDFPDEPTVSRDTFRGSPSAHMVLVNAGSFLNAVTSWYANGKPDVFCDVIYPSHHTGLRVPMRVHDIMVMLNRTVRDYLKQQSDLASAKGRICWLVASIAPGSQTVNPKTGCRKYTARIEFPGGKIDYQSRNGSDDVIRREDLSEANLEVLGRKYGRNFNCDNLPHDAKQVLTVFNAAKREISEETNGVIPEQDLNFKPLTVMGEAHNSVVIGCCNLFIRHFEKRDQ